MKRKNLYSLLIVAGGLFAACNPDGVDSVNFNVTVDNTLKEVYVGDPITFALEGKPDYIVFYSGEFGNKYANINRAETTLQSVSLSATINQRCWTGALIRGQRVHAYVSEDFKGVYTQEMIEEATWTELTGTEEGKLHYPMNEKTWDDTVASTIDFSEYKDKPFYLAFQYTIPENPTATANQPRVIVEPLEFEMKATDGEKLTMKNPQTEFAFQFIQKKGNLPLTNFSTTDTRLVVQPAPTSFGAELDIWAISQQMNLKAVSPDKGIPVKTLNSKISSYTHTYSKPGEYTASFVAMNANMWNSEKVVKEVKIVVKEKLAN